jgi:hypothetical protein
MPAVPVVYTDDTDAVLIWIVTDDLGQDLDWASPQIAVGDGAYTAATWLDTTVVDPVTGKSSREISLAFPLALGLDSGIHSARLKVPNGIDFDLGPVYVRVRS